MSGAASPDPAAQIREALDMAREALSSVQRSPEPFDLAPFLRSIADALAALAALERERDEARAHSREASEMYVRANEQLTELLSQQSFMERQLAAVRADLAEAQRALGVEITEDEREWHSAIVALRVERANRQAAEAALAEAREALREAQRRAGEAEAAVIAAREELRWYGEHKAGCEYAEHSRTLPCTCGFAAALASEGGEETLTEPDQGAATLPRAEEVPHDGRASALGAEPRPGSVSAAPSVRGGKEQRQ